MSIKILATFAVKIIFDLDGEIVVVYRSSALVLGSLVFEDFVLAICALLFNDNMPNFQSMRVVEAQTFL